jgi:hypothetical protein
MEKLTIEIDCNKRTCGKCKQMINKEGIGVVCSVFVTHLKITEKGVKRLPECIAACKAQKEEKNPNDGCGTVSCGECKNAVLFENDKGEIRFGEKYTEAYCLVFRKPLQRAFSTFKRLEVCQDTYGF